MRCTVSAAVSEDHGLRSRWRGTRVGLSVAVIAVASGHLSGARINPAVTLGFWSVRRFPTRDVLPYIVAQCAGAIAASTVLGWLLGPVGDFGATVPAVTVRRAFVIEMGYIGLLGFVIMEVATDDRVPGAGALVTGPLTGGSFNPARTRGPAVASGVWTTHWLYWVAPILGMIAVIQLYVALPRANVASMAPRRVPTGVEGPL